MTRDEIVAELFRLQDQKYGAFQAKLIPTVEADRIIGVRTPQLRAFAKKLFKDKDTAAFLTARAGCPPSLGRYGAPHPRP